MNSLETIFLHARGLKNPEERVAYLDQACGDDAGLLQRVEAMLSDSASADEYFDETPTWENPVEQASGPVFLSDEAMPEKIGPYRMLERLGQGGMGDVYRAEQRSPIRREVALKLIKLGMDTKQVVARFEAERQAMALMDHPHIAKVYGADADEKGRPYFAMEYVKGIPITEYADINHLTVRERLELFQQVCHAIQHAHQKGVIHRDIKPSNILVSTQDGRPHAKVIDFGIAKATAQRLTEKTLFTLHDQFIGTPQYMSPEQATGSLDIDTRSDVYSLGVLLYELLTGQTPFDTATLRKAAVHEIARILRDEEPPKPSTRLGNLSATQSGSIAALDTLAKARSVDAQQLVKEVRGELDWLVMKAVEKDRARRYESPGQFAEDIGRYLGGSPIEAAPPGLRYRAGKFIRKHRTAMVFTATIFLMLLGGIALTTSGLIRERKAHIAAVAAKEEAQREKANADESRSLAEKRSGELQFESYRNALQAAQNAMESGDTNAALMALDSCPAALRGWEWRCLLASADSTLDSRPFPQGTRLLATSPEGSYAAFGDRRDKPKEIILWRAADGAEVARIAPPDALEIIGCSVSSHGERVALLALNRQGPEPECMVTLFIWDSTARQIVWSYPSVLSNGFLMTSGCMLSDNGRKVVVWGKRQKDMESTMVDGTWEMLREFFLNKAMVFEVHAGSQWQAVGEYMYPGISDLSPAGGFFAEWSNYGIKMWDTASGELRLSEKSGSGNVAFVNEQQIAFRSGDDAVTRTLSGESRILCKMAGGTIARHGYLPDKDLLIWASPEKNLIHITVTEGQEHPEIQLQGIRGHIRGLWVDQAAGMILAYSDTHVSRFPIPPRSIIERFNAIANSPSQPETLVESGCESMIGRSINDGKPVDFFHCPAKTSYGRRFLRSNGYVVFPSNPVKVYRRDGQRFSLYSTAEIQNDQVFEPGTGAEVNLTGTLLAVPCLPLGISHSLYIPIYDLATGRVKFELSCDYDNYKIIGFGGHSFWLMNGDELRAYDLETGEKISLSSVDICQAAVLFADGDRLACLNGVTISIYDTETFHRLRSWTVPRASEGELEWLAGGHRLLCRGIDSAAICDVDRGTVLFETQIPERKLLGPFGRSSHSPACFVELPFRDRWDDILKVDALESDLRLREWAVERVRSMYASGVTWDKIEGEAAGEDFTLIQRVVLADEVAKAKAKFKVAEKAIQSTWNPFFTRSLLRKSINDNSDPLMREALLYDLINWHESNSKVSWSRVLDSEISADRCREIQEQVDALGVVDSEDVEWNGLRGALAYRAGDYPRAKAILTSIPSLADVRLAKDWDLERHMMCFLAMTEFRLGDRAAASRALRFGFWGPDAEWHIETIQREALTMVMPVAPAGPIGASREARKIADEALAKLKMPVDEEQAEDPLSPPVEIHGTVVRICPIDDNIGVNLILDSVEKDKALHIWIDFRKVKGLDLDILSKFEGHDVAFKGGVKLYGERPELVITSPEDIKCLNPDEPINAWWEGGPGGPAR